MSDLLKESAITLTRIMVPAIMFVGILGNSMNIAVLTRPALYKHACSHYFLVLAINNLFYTSVVLTYRVLADGFQIDPTKNSLITCKLFTYINHVSAVLGPYFIVLASIDRYCASSLHHRIRKISDVKVSRWIILFTFLLIAAFYSNTAILIDVQSTDTFGCRIRADSVYKQIYPIIQVFSFGFLAPCLMIIFGILTILNTKRIVVAPIAVSSFRRTESQLVRMLLIQVITHILLVIPTCVTYLILVLPLPITSTSGFFFARMVSQFPLHLSYAITFLMYLLSASVYKKQFMRLARIALRMRVSTQVHPTEHTMTFVATINKIKTNQTISKRNKSNLNDGGSHSNA